MRHLRRFGLSLLRSEYINYCVFKLRFFYFVSILKRLKVFQDESSVIGNDYSRNMLLKGTTSNRPLKFIRPLSVIESVNKQGRTLSIGCRFETELLYLAAYGFSWCNIRGLDMISYSPLVDLGNMHSMPYEDNYFDTITMGWLISYSEEPERAAKEVIRVLKPGGIVAVAVAYYPPVMVEKFIKENSYVADPRKRIQSPEGILNLFQGYVNQVYFRHLPQEDREGACTVIFSIKK